MEFLNEIMNVYEVISGIGILIQVVLIVSRRANSTFMTLGVTLDAVGLSGMACVYAVRGDQTMAIIHLVIMLVDVAYVMFITYREGHPRPKDEPKKSPLQWAKEKFVK